MAIVMGVCFVILSCSQKGLNGNSGNQHSGKGTQDEDSSGNKKDSSDFVFWQLTSTSNTIGMSYVFKMNDGKIAVLDGGEVLKGHGKNGNKDILELMNFIHKVSGGYHITAWFISHPHPDHVGALYSLLKWPHAVLNNPSSLKIGTIYYSKLTHEQIGNSPFYNSVYSTLENSGFKNVSFTKPGKVITIDKTHFKILSVRNPEIKEAKINNSSMAIRVWDKSKSILFLGDLEIKGGNKLLNGSYRDDLSVDYVQMAHHGNHGVSFDFYRSIYPFKYCLWPTPSWLWTGGGHYNTLKYRRLVDSLGVKKNYVAWKGTVEIK